MSFAAAAGPAAASAACDRVAAPGGSDGSPGTAAQPFATPHKLFNALSAGQTGCVRGTISGDLKMTQSGRADAPITVTSEPGQRGRIIGRIWIADGANFVNVTDLDLDGRNSRRLPSPLILSDDVRFERNDVSNGNTAICFNLGAATYTPNATADRTLIQGNRIHNCGKLPAENHDHGVYVEKTRDARILGNVIYDNADRAVQLYPDAQRTLVEGNVMDGNGQGVIISGDLGMTSNDNLVRNNVITNPLLRDAIESWYPSGHAKGTGNLVTNNCVHGGAGTHDTSDGGFTMSNNLFVDPQYVDRGAKDFRLRAGSPCAAVLAGAAVAAPATSLGTPGVTTAEPPSETVLAPAPVATKPKTSPRPAKRKLRTYAKRSRLKVRLRRDRKGLRAIVRLPRRAEGRSLRLRVRHRAGWQTVAKRSLNRRTRVAFRVSPPRGVRRVMVRARLGEKRPVVASASRFVRRR